MSGYEALQRLRVHAGASLLDNHFGPQWALRVNLNTLHIASPEDCILGQLFGDYVHGLDALNIHRVGDPVELGFVAVGERYWLRAIHRRRRKLTRHKHTYAKAA
jgi:hypothetical protein